jgi:dephospho-CoA kinase
MEKYLDLVLQFNQDIIGLPIPDSPSRLDPGRKKWASRALSEELTEFVEAAELEDEVDALVDLAYFALGRIIEMGVVPGAAFEEVHAANMAKVRGELSKRPDSKGFDAIKPDGWQPPNLLPYLALSRQQVRAAYAAALSEQDAAEGSAGPGISPAGYGKPKLLVIGQARHGKDTVAEILERDYGFKFTSSSFFCAEKVIWDAVQSPHKALDRYVEAGCPGVGHRHLKDELDLMRNRRYTDAEACFEDRGNFRTTWFSLIAAYCYPEKERLAREIFAENDIYVGIRNKRELWAVINSGLVDYTIWVDASERSEAELMSSCTVEPWMADCVVDNNGSEEDLERNVHQLMATLGLERKI